MAKKLIIVESPAKAKTIAKILGREFDVTSSMGHVIDLPASRLGVDIEHDFQPDYIVIQSRRKIAKQLRQQVAGKEEIYLAPDPDREGEAISWHLAELLTTEKFTRASRSKKKPVEPTNGAPTKPTKARKSPAGPAAGVKVFRISFHEITPQAIKEAFKHPGQIDFNKVNAQQARRVLDRLVGYSLSPLLWKKVGRGLSAGRVQSVALRLIVEREREVEAFVPQEYWTIEAKLRKAQGEDRVFTAQLDKIDGKKAEVKTGEQAANLVDDLKRQTFTIASVETRKQSRYPKAPFITSSLQQEAFHKLGFSGSRTMRLAQDLYEGLDIGEENPVGLITYMRTDSARVATEAVAACRGFIEQQYGKDFLPEAPRTYKARASAQQAHEAIRPTSVERHPSKIASYLSEDQAALYQLIWNRFVASQMSDAVEEVVSVQIAAGKYHLKTTGRRMLFDGWTKVYQETDEKEPREGELPDAGILPPLADGEALALMACTPGQHFTKPPRRYTDASLVKTLEEQGIGRPSTYAPIILTLIERDYMRRIGGSFQPTKLGRTVNDLLIEHFPEVLNVKFTAEMEDQLDRIEDGNQPWVNVVRSFYEPFVIKLSQAVELMREVKREVTPTGEHCEKCGKPLVVKWGRFGQFIACSGFPDCKNAKPMPTGVACQREGCAGQLIERRARGRVFYGCSTYPNCTFTTRRLPKEPAA